TAGTLGYSDAEFAQALPYAVIRFFGADPFLAFQLMGFTQNMIGFAAMFTLARYQIASPWWLAAAAAFTTAFANGVHAQLMHMQILTVNYYPVILLFLVGAAIQLKRSQLQASLLSAGAGLSLAALLFTSYYIGFFFVLLTTLVLILYVAFDWRWIRD